MNEEMDITSGFSTTRFWEYVAKENNFANIGMVAKCMIGMEDGVPVNVRTLAEMLVIDAQDEETERLREMNRERVRKCREKALQKHYNSITKHYSNECNDNVMISRAPAHNAPARVPACTRVGARDKNIILNKNNIYNNIWEGGVGETKNRIASQSELNLNIKPQPKEAERIPPTIEMVAAYCAKVGATFSPQAFIDFYESKGWVVGKSKMKNWQAAVRTWMRMDRNPNSTGLATSHKTASNQSVGYIHQDPKYRNRLLEN